MSTKFAKFARLYFLQFTTFHKQTSQLYETWDALSSYGDIFAYFDFFKILSERGKVHLRLSNCKNAMLLV